MHSFYFHPTFFDARSVEHGSYAPSWNAANGELSAPSLRPIRWERTRTVRATGTFTEQTAARRQVCSALLCSFSLGCGVDWLWHIPFTYFLLLFLFNSFKKQTASPRCRRPGFVEVFASTSARSELTELLELSLTLNCHLIIILILFFFDCYSPFLFFRHRVWSSSTTRWLAFGSRTTTAASWLTRWSAAATHYPTLNIIVVVVGDLNRINQLSNSA